MQTQKKCPNCGAIIPSLSIKCTGCDYVFSRESESSEVAREAIERLQTMLKEIDASHKIISKKKLASAKATIITTFVVPNTKEAMVNFLILAFSNIESSSETQDPAITMAWEARAISTYNLLKLQQNSDPQIESVLQKYSILENKKKLAKIDGRAKKAAKKRKVIACIIFVLLICLSPFAIGVINELNYDPILDDIENGRYDEAIEKINNDDQLKQNVDFYIDLLSASPIASATTQIDIDYTTGVRTKTTIMKDGSKDIYKSDYQDYNKNIEKISYRSDGSIEQHIIDSLKLGEKLWSILQSPNYLDPLELYTYDSLEVHLDDFGRCETLSFSNNGAEQTFHFTYDKQNNIIQQDIYSDRDTTIITTTASRASNNIAFFVDMTDNAFASQFITRTFDEHRRITGYTKRWEILGQDYLIARESYQEFNRLSITTYESITQEKLQEFDFEGGPVVHSREIRNLQNGKGVRLDYTKLTPVNNSTE